MKTILLADDERPARELLKMTLDWQALGFAVPFEAANGQQALELYRQHHPDFVITDIQMPIMDGLELIRRIKEENPEQRVVVLSCHESFSYAQQAIKMGVIDYIVKDAMNADALAEILLSGDADAERRPLPTRQPAPNVLQAFLNEELDGAAAAERLEPYLKKCRYLCCLIACGKSVAGDAHLGSTLQLLADTLGQHTSGDVCWAGGNLFYVLALLPQTISGMELLSERARLLKALRTAAEQALGGNVTIGVSSESGDAGLLGQKITEAKTAQQSFVFLGRGKTIYYDETQAPSRVSGVKTLNLRIERVKNALQENNFDAARNEITLLYQKDLTGMLQYHYLQHVNTLLLSALTERCLAAAIPFEAVFGDETLVTTPEAAGCETVEELLAWFLQRFDHFFSCAQSQTQYEQSPRIKKIQHYIETNYNQDISLETVAEHFGLHKVYLAKVFKADADCSVNEYIRMVKTEKAKELLRQKQLKISAIIEMLGFNNPQTFYNMFHNCVGISPKEYREQLADKNAGPRE